MCDAVDLDVSYLEKRKAEAAKFRIAANKKVSDALTSFKKASKG